MLGQLPRVCHVGARSRRRPARSRRGPQYSRTPGAGVAGGGGGRGGRGRGGGLLRRGGAGLGLPPGLVDDLAALTAPHPAPEGGLNDARLAALSDDPGITRLRDLAWPAPARLAFTPLLTSRLDI